MASHPSIKGKRVILRNLKEKEVPLYNKWINDPRVIINTAIKPCTLKEETEWFNRALTDATVISLCIELKEGGQPIGTCGIHEVDKKDDPKKGVMLGIIIGAKEHWNKGYGTEVVKLLTDYVKKVLKAKRIWLTVGYDNVRAKACYLKCGFKVVETRKSPYRNGINKEYVMVYQSTD